MKVSKCINRAVVLILLVILSSCAGYPDRPLRDSSRVYSVQNSSDLLNRHAPVFVIEEAAQEYNRIGTVTASQDGEAEVVRIDPQTATYYTSKQNFQTDKGVYTNLFYRVHFPEVPLSLIPFYLGAGDNVGLLAVITLNESDEPVLYTLVHTCGCYLAFIPTSYLHETSFKKGWQKDRQTVFGENLPASLQFKKKGDEKLVIHVRHASHRVKNVWLATSEDINSYSSVIPRTEPFEALEKLELADGSFTSFYETSGARKGYVKGSHKIWERALISWWAFDWRVGEDKKLGRDLSDGIVFYTSLKPWAREESDLRDFAGFLRYWGWKL